MITSRAVPASGADGSVCALSGPSVAKDKNNKMGSCERTAPNLPRRPPQVKMSFVVGRELAE
jgi:hypothetical protein